MWILGIIVSFPENQWAELINMNLIDITVNILKNCPIDEIVFESYFLIGNLAAQSPSYRNEMLNKGVLLELLKNEKKCGDNLKRKENLTWVVTNFLRGQSLPPYDLVKESFPFVCKSLK